MLVLNNNVSKLYRSQVSLLYKELVEDSSKSPLVHSYIALLSKIIIFGIKVSESL